MGVQTFMMMLAKRLVGAIRNQDIYDNHPERLKLAGLIIFSVDLSIYALPTPNHGAGQENVARLFTSFHI